MLDGLLGRGFSSKCKSSIKLIKARIDVIRRKRNAMQKFLKKDIADLLANNLEINAYGRAEGLLVELNLSFCYDLVEQFCGSIPRHLSVIQKQSECPEECREAVSSLMFAAARFADLPELRDIRQMFTEKYGNYLEPFVNREFAEKLASNPPTVDQKLQLMRDITKEFSVKWNSKDFEQKVSNPPAAAQVRPARHGSLQDRHDDGNRAHISRVHTSLKRDTEDVLTRGRRELTNDGLKPKNGNQETILKREKEDNSFRGRRELTNDGYRAHNVAAEETVMKKDSQDVSSHGRWETANDGFKPRSSREATVLKRDHHEVWSRGRREHTVDGNQPHNVVEETVLKRESNDVPSQGRREFIDNGFKPRNGREDTVLNRENRDISSRGRRELSDDGDGTILKREDRHGRRELTDDGFNLRNGRKDSIPKRDNIDDSYHGRREQFDDGYRLHGSKEDVVHRRDNQHISSCGRWDHAKKDTTENHSAVKETEKDCEEAERAKPHYKGMVPPPYVRPNGGKYGTRNVNSDSEKTPEDPPVYKRDLNDRSERTHNERQEFGPARVNHVDENEYRHHDDLVSNRMPKPKPTSVRRRHLKPPPGYENTTGTEGDEVVRRNQSGRSRGDPRLGLQQALDEDLNDVKDEEEKMMDQLLMHYSKKPSKFEPGRVKAGLNSNTPPLRREASERHQSRNSVRMKESAHPPTRAASLPLDPAVIPTEEAGKAPARANSLQPERVHVHPKLPEYDDLAARIASLRQSLEAPKVQREREREREMKDTAKLVMGATLIMVVSLAIVLALVLVLLAELYCSLLLRKRRFPTTSTTTVTSPQPSQYSSSSAPLSSVYSQGVLLAAPRSFLFPSMNINKQQGQEKEENHKQKQQNQKHYPNSDDQVLEILTQDPNNNPNRIGFISASPSSVSLATSPHQQPIHQEVALEVTNSTTNSIVGGGGGGDHEHFVYISNPIYDNEISCRQGGGGGGGIGTPFETPDSSPSHLEMEDGCWSGEEEEGSSPSSSLPMTPPLTPMKKLLPMEACSSVSVSLRDVGISGVGIKKHSGIAVLDSLSFSLSLYFTEY
ncbi:protein of unknown function DUF292 [Macleaya cordata]|uniref:Vacuolar protein sorting-associated protein Ist1 n=1 Tax=Macleaya cordata TaxID=56857 RepID=A0A200PP02_MACCD|nr:protein of unknown function DUF292 [Macleaya cordata]